MAGSINLSLSQQFDKLNGTLLSGGRLYFYAAGTDSPQNAYKDTNLTLVHPNPIILASDGRIPQLYFADGSIHVRLTNSAGVVQFDEDAVLVVGPSDGGGGGGSTVDANAIFQTGDVLWLPVQGNRSGWVRCNGGTIGNSGSGADYHAADGQALFEHLYNTYNNTYCPVSGGRTGSALNDFNNGKTIATLDFREMMICGLSDMGKADRGGFNSVPVERDGRTTAAGIIGSGMHALVTGELASHTHTGTSDGNNVDHTHSYNAPGPSATTGTASGVSAGGGGGNIWYGGGVSGSSTGGESVPHSHSFTTAATGSGTAHNNTPRTMLGTFYMRL
jgi:hypothetical protein